MKFLNEKRARAIDQPDSGANAAHVARQLGVIEKTIRR